MVIRSNSEDGSRVGLQPSGEFAQLQRQTVPRALADAVTCLACAAPVLFACHAPAQVSESGSRNNTLTAELV